MPLVAYAPRQTQTRVYLYTSLTKEVLSKLREMLGPDVKMMELTSTEQMVDFNKDNPRAKEALVMLTLINDDIIK